MIEQTYTIADIWWATAAGALFSAAAFFELGRWMQRRQHRRWLNTLQGIE